MSNAETEKGAAAKVLRRWRSGRIPLAVYAVGTALPMLFLWPFHDRRRLDLFEASLGVLLGGAVLLVLVGVRTAWASDAPAEWRSDLAGPEELESERQVAYGALVTVVAAGVLTWRWIIFGRIRYSPRSRRSPEEARSSLQADSGRPGAVPPARCQRGGPQVDGPVEPGNAGSAVMIRRSGEGRGGLRARGRGVDDEVAVGSVRERQRVVVQVQPRPPGGRWTSSRWSSPVRHGTPTRYGTSRCVRRSADTSSAIRASPG